jgi:poly [ADP-ribose] polymerase 7/11/12/13
MSCFASFLYVLSIGTVYGVGVYFSSNAAYSHGYTSKNQTNERCMFVARVLVGKTTVGNGSMKTPPVGFDSTTDGKHIFVTYHDAQAFAEYLITYK